jgi:CRP-like cAMP-binding protein
MPQYCRTRREFQAVQRKWLGNAHTHAANALVIEDEIRAFVEAEEQAYAAKTLGKREQLRKGIREGRGEEGEMEAHMLAGHNQRTVYGYDSWQRFGWSLVHCACILYYVTVPAYRVAHVLPTENGGTPAHLTVYTDVFVDLLVWLGAALKLHFFTESIDGVFVSNRKQVRQHFINKDLAWLVVSTFTLDFCLGFVSNEALYVARVLRMIHVRELSAVFAAFIFSNQKGYSVQEKVWRILLLVARLWVFIHWMGCVWVLLARASNESDNWLAAFSVPGETFGAWTSMLTSIYFVTATISSVGYGDIHPFTQSETLFAVFVILVGGVIYSTVTGAFASMTSNLDPAGILHRGEEEHNQTFMTRRGVSAHQRTLVEGEVRKQWYRYKGGSSDDCVGFLPPETHKFLSHELYVHLLDRTPLFHNLNEMFLKRLATKCVFKSFPQGSMLFRRGRLYHELLVVTAGESRELQPNKAGIQEVFAFRQRQDREMEALAQQVEEDKHTTFMRERQRQVSISISRGVSRSAPDAQNASSLDDGSETAASKRSAPLTVRGVDYLHSPVPVSASESVIAISNVECVSMQVTDVLALLAQHPEVQNQVLFRSSLVRAGQQESKKEKLDISQDTFMLIHSKLMNVLKKVRRRMLEKKQRAERWRHHVHSKESPFRVRWTFAASFLALFQVISIPGLLAFGFNGGVFAMLVLCDAFFVWDLLLRSRYFTRMRVNGVDVALTASEISASFYKLSWSRVVPVLMHFLTVLPMDKLLYFFQEFRDRDAVDYDMVMTLGLLHLLQIARFPAYSRNIDVYMQNLKHTSVGYRTRQVVTLSFSLTLLVHLLACFWFFVGGISNTPTSPTWYNSKVADVTMLPFSERYMYSVYWAVVTISSTGYGDVTGFSNAEMLFFALAAFLAAVANAAIIGSKAANAAHHDRLHTRYVKMTVDLKHYLATRNVNPHAVRGLMDYHAYIYKHDTVLYDESMPATRRGELKHELYAPLLSEVRRLCFPFATELSDGLFYEMAGLMKPQVFLQKQLIVRKGDIGERLYMIHDGECQVWLSKGATQQQDQHPSERVRTRGVGTRQIFLSRGHFFGELALLLPNQTRTASVVSLSPVQCFYVEREGWRKLMQSYAMLATSVVNSFLDRALSAYPDVIELLVRVKTRRALKIERLTDLNVQERLFMQKFPFCYMGNKQDETNGSEHKSRQRSSLVHGDVRESSSPPGDLQRQRSLLDLPDVVERNMWGAAADGEMAATQKEE